jgi:hypothetical protein
MRKVVRNRSVTIAPVALYKPDIDSIIRSLSDAGHPPVVQVDDWEIAWPAELAGLPMSQFSRLKITVRDPYVSLTVERGSAWLYSGDDTPVAMGLFSVVEKALLGLVQRPHGFYRFGRHTWAVLVASVLLQTATTLLLLLWWRNPMRAILGGIAVYVVGMLLFRRFTGSTWADQTLSIKERPAVDSFWRRNRDRIVSDLLIAIVSSLLGVCATVAVQRFARKAAVPAVPSATPAPRDSAR